MSKNVSNNLWKELNNIEIFVSYEKIIIEIIDFKFDLGSLLTMECGVEDALELITKEALSIPKHTQTIAVIKLWGTINYYVS